MDETGKNGTLPSPAPAADTGGAVGSSTSDDAQPDRPEDVHPVVRESAAFPPGPGGPHLAALVLAGRTAEAQAFAAEIRERYRAMYDRAAAQLEG